MRVVALRATTPAEAQTPSTRRMAREMRDQGKQGSTRRADTFRIEGRTVRVLERLR